MTLGELCQVSYHLQHSAHCFVSYQFVISLSLVNEMSIKIPVLHMYTRGYRVVIIT